MKCKHPRCQFEAQRRPSGALVITDDAGNGYCSWGCYCDEQPRRERRGRPLASPRQLSLPRTH